MTFQWAVVDNIEQELREKFKFINKNDTVKNDSVPCPKVIEIKKLEQD